MISVLNEITKLRDSGTLGIEQNKTDCYRTVYNSPKKIIKFFLIRTETVRVVFYTTLAAARDWETDQKIII